jgi:NADH:ubiquinone oxidoreductase subunit E
MSHHSGCSCQTAAPVSPEVWAKIDAIIQQHKDQPGALMPVLQAVQEVAGSLPPAVQERIATGLNIREARSLG